MSAVLLPVIVACPLLGSLLLLASGGRMPRRATGVIGVGSVGLAAAVALGLATHLILTPPAIGAIHIRLWDWIEADGFSAWIAFALDPLSLLMMLVVTVVGFLIHLYAYGYMRDDPDIARFFAYMNLFVASMLVLVFSSDLLSLFIGWEGVGACSFLLIGFWYRDPANGVAARKAFMITRLGDAAMLCGLLLIATTSGTLDMASLTPGVGHPPAGMALQIAMLLLLMGAIAKSAQVPFQTWLPDAMAGPTPVSALIHAATMVTAGVYLVARLHGMFAHAPIALAAMSAIGLITLLLAAGCALVQTDIKRILAYSTMSQLGYMFLALGTGAWEAAVFHLVTHAFFKALLFMTAGAIILRVHHKQDIREMGGLWRSMPGVCAAFVAGAAALAGMPLLTAGFYSKEMILQNAWHSNPVLWFGAVCGAFLTSLYIFRCVFIVFLGRERTRPTGRTSLVMGIPLVCLSVLALGGGLIEAPSVIAPVHLLSALVSPMFGAPEADGGIMLLVIGSLVPLAGISVAWIVWRPSAPQTNIDGPVARFARGGWGFDRLYEVIIVRPLMTAGIFNRGDVFDRMSFGLAAAVRSGGGLLGRMQSGRVRWYAGWIAAGTAVALCLAVLS